MFPKSARKKSPRELPTHRLTGNETFNHIPVFPIICLKSFKEQDGGEGREERERENQLCDISIQPKTKTTTVSALKNYVYIYYIHKQNRHSFSGELHPSTNGDR